MACWHGGVGKNMYGEKRRRWQALNRTGVWNVRLADLFAHWVGGIRRGVNGGGGKGKGGVRGCRIGHRRVLVLNHY